MTNEEFREQFERSCRDNKKLKEEIKEVLLRAIEELNKPKENKNEPIRMSKLEYSILEYLADNTRHMYICRDANGKLFLYDMEPHKDKNEDWWVGKGVEPFIPFNKLFQFVKWSDEKPRAIKEVLNDCHVIEDRINYHEVTLHE